MEAYELSDLASELAKIRDYLATLASVDDGYSGQASARLIGNSDEATAILTLIEEIPAKLAAATRLCHVCGRDIADDFTSLLIKSDFQRQISRISTKIRIAKAKQSIPISSFFIFRAFSTLLGMSKKRMFEEQGLNLEELISDANLLRSKVVHLRELLFQKEYSNQEGFKPSNIDSNTFIDLLEQAVISINESSSIPDRLRKQLVDQLNEAKAETYKDRPSWQNIIGTLVIVSTIISGIAATPDAAINLKKAYDYIVGHSVPDQLPLHHAVQFTPSSLHLSLPPRRTELPIDEQESED